MNDFKQMLNQFSLPLLAFKEISPQSFYGDHENLDAYYEKLVIDIRNYLYKHLYDSRILLHLADDVDTNTRKDRLVTTVIPFLLENKIIERGF